MKTFKEEKLEIVDSPSSIVIEAFRRGLLRSSKLFSQLTKTMPYSMEETYDKARKFVQRVND